MNIIIPLGGKGERFSKSGYKQAKPLINILDKKITKSKNFKGFLNLNKISDH